MFENVRLKCCLYRIGSVFAFKPIYYKLYYCKIFVRDSHWTILSYILTTYTASSSIYELFQIFSLQFRIVPNAVRVHRVPFLFSYTQILSEWNAPITVLVSMCCSIVPNQFECRQNASCTGLVIKMLAAVPNRFECRQNAPFIVLVFKMLSTVP